MGSASSGGWCWRRNVGHSGLLFLNLVLPTHDEDGEAAGNDGWPWVRIVRSWVGSGAELGGHQINAIGGGVIGHGAGAALGGQVLNGGIVGRRGIDYGKNSLVAGGEG